MSAAPDSIGPGYSTVARQYLEAGWAPLPLPAGQKASPPTGTTGADGAWPTEDDIDRWKAQHPNGNIALRMPDTVIGIDVDDYDGKEGGATLAELEAQDGPLPPTWLSTSRGPGISGIRLYRIPAGVRLPGVLGPGIDVIQHHHRYMVVAPSVHPNGGRYRIYDPSGVRATRPPAVDELPNLPAAWLQRHRLDKPAAPTVISAGIRLDDEDSIAARLKADHDWHQVLYQDGWTMTAKHGTETRWARPGKDTGTSAVLHEPDGPFVVFTTNVAQLQQPWAGKGDHWSYSLFGYFAATRHHGDRSACASAYRRHITATASQHHTLQTSVVAREVLDGQIEDTVDYAHLVDWKTFWTNDTADEDWLAYPLIPRGRAVALYAPAKAGKSTIVLSVVAALATGGDILGYGPSPAADVLYLDYEMTSSDLMERLTELGYGPDTDLSRLHYALLPSLAPLDTLAGSAAVIELAERLGVQLVVVDTFGRAVEGDEDKADTVRAFYRHTGLALKARGIAVLRTDHAGKDVERGQRGSSAKSDDVDVVLQLKRTDEGVNIKRTHSRIAWGPSEIAIERRHYDGITVYTTGGDHYPAGTKEMIAILEQAGIGADVSARKAAQQLREAGQRLSNDLVRAAQRARKRRAGPVENHGENVRRGVPARSDDTLRRGIPAHSGAPPETLASTPARSSGAVRRGVRDEPGAAPPYIGGAPDVQPDGNPQADLDDLF